MATNIVQGKWDHVKEEEEESLLLCDVPITMINKKDQEKLRKEDSSYYLNEAQEEFDFLFFKEQQMCDADDVFFQGQILPLCPSFRSEYGLLIKHDDHHKGNHQLNHSQSISSNNPTCLSSSGTCLLPLKQRFRFESCGWKKYPLGELAAPHTCGCSRLEYDCLRCGYTCGKPKTISYDKSLEFQSNSSSRSSSVRSQNSSCSSSTSSTSTTISTINTTPRISISKPIIQNQFHTRPSPKPQLRKSQQKQTSGRKSSLSWEFFRIGLVPMHEIGLRDLKVHSTITTTKPFFSNPNKNCSNPSMNCRNPNMNCSNPNKSCSNPNKNHVSCNNSTRKNVKMGNKVYDHQHHHGDENNYDVLKQFVYKGSGLFMSGCKCSIETVALENVMIKCGTKSGNKTQSTKHAKKEKVVDLKKQKNREKK